MPDNRRRRAVARGLAACFTVAPLLSCVPELSIPDIPITCASDAECPRGFTCNASQHCSPAASTDRTPPGFASPAALDRDRIAARSTATLSLATNEPLRDLPRVALHLGAQEVPFACTGDDGRTHFTCVLTPDGTENASLGGEGPVSVELVDAAFNVTRLPAIDRLTLDFEEPDVARVSLTVRYDPTDENPIRRPTALGDEATVFVAFNVTEPLEAAPTLLAPDSPQLAFDAPTTQGLGYFFTGRLEVDDFGPQPAQGAQDLRVLLRDEAGNEQTVDLLDALVVDTVAPEAPDTLTPGRITLVRAPWGDMDSVVYTPSFGLVGLAGAVEPDSTVLAVQDFGLGGAREIGRDVAREDGGFGGEVFLNTFALTNDTARAVFLRTIDGAGNKSLDAIVRDVRWTAGFEGRSPGDVFTNPHRVDIGTVANEDLQSRTPRFVSGTFDAIDYTTLARKDDIPLRFHASAGWRPHVPTTAHPPALSGSLLAWDATRGVTLLAGGADRAGRVRPAAWEWNGTRWSERSTPFEAQAERPPFWLAVDPFTGTIHHNYWSSDDTGFDVHRIGTPVPYAPVGGLVGLAREEDGRVTTARVGRSDNGRFLYDTPFPAEARLLAKPGGGVLAYHHPAPGAPVSLWELRPGGWSALAPSPPVSRIRGLATVLARGRLVLVEDDGAEVLTHEWDGATWFPARRQAGLPRSASTWPLAEGPGGRVVTVVELDPTGPSRPATLGWDGERWTRLAPSSPPRTGDGSLLAVGHEGELLFLGAEEGRTSATAHRWDGTSWREVDAAGAPWRSRPSAWVDGSTARPMIAGGSVCAACPDRGDPRYVAPSGHAFDTWEMDVDGTWRRVSSAGPGPRTGAAATTVAGIPFLIGGRSAADGTPLDELWRWTNAAWEPVPWSGDFPRTFDGLAAAPGGRLLVFGGSGVDGSRAPAIVAFEDGTFAPTSRELQSETHADRAAGTLDLRDGRPLYFGGRGLEDGYRNETVAMGEEGFLPLPASPSPPARVDASLAFDPRRGRSLLFGGRAGLNAEDDGPATDTWELLRGRDLQPVLFAHFDLRSMEQERTYNVGSIKVRTTARGLGGVGSSASDHAVVERWSTREGRWVHMIRADYDALLEGDAARDAVDCSIAAYDTCGALTLRLRPEAGPGDDTADFRTALLVDHVEVQVHYRRGEVAAWTPRARGRTHRLGGPVRGPPYEPNLVVTARRAPGAEAPTARWRFTDGRTFDFTIDPPPPADGTTRSFEARIEGLQFDRHSGLLDAIELDLGTDDATLESASLTAL